jgi:hypothetical protein
MKKGIIEKLKEDEASAVVEAVISFAGFLFVIFTILNVVNFCRAQMLISNAVDTATKELTQYSYFYKMSGLQKLSDDYAAKVDAEKANINGVIGSVDEFYTALAGAQDDSVEQSTNVKNAIEEGNLNLDDIQNALSSLKTDAVDIEKSMKTIDNAFGAVQDNPMAYMKSIAAIAGKETIDILTSHCIAAPLSRLFVAKHFGSSVSEANEKLKAIGVVDGLDGMNFKMSTLFNTVDVNDATKNGDVHIVVYYRLSMVQLFNWATLDVPICKESVARGWLAGDNPQAKIQEKAPAATTGGGQNTADNPAESEKPSETTKADETTAPAETEKPEKKVDIEGSFWHMGDGGPNLDEPIQILAFREKFFSEYGIDENYAMMYGSCYDTTLAPNQYYSCGIAKTAEDERYSVFMMSNLADMKQRQDAGEISKTEKIDYTFIIYVPENISEEEYSSIQKELRTVMVACNDGKAEGKYPSNVNAKFKIEKAGGNYDYGSTE